MPDRLFTTIGVREYMKKILVKCSDERSRRYSVITTIIEEGDEKHVLKEPVYPEGEKHIRELASFRDVLSAAYPQIIPCPVRIEDGKAVFDFIKGESLEKRYNEAVEYPEIRRPLRRSLTVTGICCVLIRKMKRSFLLQTNSGHGSEALRLMRASRAFAPRTSTRSRAISFSRRTGPALSTMSGR